MRHILFKGRPVTCQIYFATLYASLLRTTTMVKEKAVMARYSSWGEMGTPNRYAYKVSWMNSTSAFFK